MTEEEYREYMISGYGNDLDTDTIRTQADIARQLTIANEHLTRIVNLLIEIQPDGTNKREQLIQEIEGLFPADSQYIMTKRKGVELLDIAKRDCNNWRNLPDKILSEYARLCREEENRQAKAATDG